jgi:outer membrane immunogenic protein
MLWKSLAAAGVRLQHQSRRLDLFRPLTAASVLALACAVTFGSAGAEGLPDRRSSLKDLHAPVPVPFVYDWSGLYFGAHLGGAWGDLDRTLREGLFDDNGHQPVALPEGASVRHSFDGSIAGGHIGFNEQRGRWVFGVEASFSGFDLSDTTTHIAFEAEENNNHNNDNDDENNNNDNNGDKEIDTFTVTSEMDGLFLATVRLGRTFDRWLGYLRIGYASARVKLRGTQEFIDEDDDEEIEAAFSSSERHHGLAIGGGLEYALTDRVILGLEYNYIGLGSKTHRGLARVTELMRSTVRSLPRGWTPTGSTPCGPA